MTHNVEFTLHPSKDIAEIRLSEDQLPFTTVKIKKKIDAIKWGNKKLKSAQLLTAGRLLRNSCIIYEDKYYLVVAYLGDKHGNE